MVKQLYREFRGIVSTLAEIRDTVERILATLDEMNKKSEVFWAEFKRDFPETWEQMNVGIQRLPTIEPLAGPPMCSGGEVVEVKLAS